MKRLLSVLVLTHLSLLPGGCRSARVATPAVPAPYDASFREAAREIWVAPPPAGAIPELGTRAAPYRSIRTALDTVNRTTLTQPVVIHLAGGEYRENLDLEDAIGTRERPLVIDTDYGCDGVACNPRIDVASIVGTINIRNSRFVYLTGSVSTRHPTTGQLTLRFDATDLTGDVDNLLQCADCTNFLVRFVEGRGSLAVRGEILKVNQSTHVYVENSDFSGSTVQGKNPIDFLAVRHGHIIDSKMHHSGDWCGYVKGGSSDIAVDGNEMYDCGTGGFSVGEGTGLESMTTGYTRYEATAVRVTNNVIRNTGGVGLNVQGAYNALLAHNTLRDVGHDQVIAIDWGARSCDGDADGCGDRVRACAWGPAVVGGGLVLIPNRHVYVLNNVIVNSPGRATPQIFSIAADSTNAPPPPEFPSDGCGEWPLRLSATGADIVFEGNLVLNGDGTTPWIGANDACAEECVRERNVRSAAVDLSGVLDANHRPVDGSMILTHRTVAMPDFSDVRDGGSTAEENAAPRNNRIPLDRAKSCRALVSTAGAYAYTASEASARSGDVCSP